MFIPQRVWDPTGLGAVWWGLAIYLYRRWVFYDVFVWLGFDIFEEGYCPMYFFDHCYEGPFEGVFFDEFICNFFVIFGVSSGLIYLYFFCNFAEPHQSAPSASQE